MISKIILLPVDPNVNETFGVEVLEPDADVVCGLNVKVSRLVEAFGLSGLSLFPALCLRSLSLALSFLSRALSFLSLVLSLELLSVRSLTFMGVGGKSITFPFPSFASSKALLNSLAISGVLNLQEIHLI